MEALGLIEVIGFVTAIEAADAALKAANVGMVDSVKVGSGIVTVIFSGDVSAVKSAVESGKLAAEKIGKIRSVHVIPSADDTLKNIIGKNTSGIQKEGDRNMSIQQSKTEDKKSEKVKNVYGADLSTSPIAAVTYVEAVAGKTPEQELKGKTNSELRSIAINMGMDNDNVKYANKSDLIQMIVENRKEQ